MARIRTIKPEFFSSDDICALSPLARLLYIGLWCEADREGRMVWAPRAFKRRYLPDDECDIEALCGELTGRNLVCLYGEQLAYIPTFSTHQHVNPREQRTKLPDPPHDASSRVTHASPPVSDAQVGREGKEGEGKEGEGSRVRDEPAHASAHAMPKSWKAEHDDIVWAKTKRPDLTLADLESETERLRNYAKAHGWMAVDWSAKWRNWIMDKKRTPPSKEDAAKTVTDHDSESQWRARLKTYRPGGFWMDGQWGPRPESGRAQVPAAVLAEWQQGTEIAA